MNVERDLTNDKDYVRSILEAPARLYKKTDRARETLERLRSQATKVTTHLTGTPGGGGGDPELLLARLVDARDTLNRLIFAEIDAREFVSMLISKSELTAPQKKIAYLRYVVGCTWPHVLSAINQPDYIMSERTMYRENTNIIDTITDFYQKGDFDEEDTDFVRESL